MLRQPQHLDEMITRWRAACVVSGTIAVLVVCYSCLGITGGGIAWAPGCRLCHKPSTLPDGWRWDTYHTHEELERFLAWINKTYPLVATVYSIGHSVQGRELLAVELAGRHIPYLFWQKKPKVKVVGNIHGNEQANREVLLRLVHHLADGYSRRRRVTQLLDNVNIHILPSMNPDGFTANTRHNANGFDMNRNFPLDAMPYAPPGPAADNDSETVKQWRATGAGDVQPEVAAVMEWSKRHKFVLSASLHQGALVANYPHDACDTQGLTRECPTQEDPLPLFLAQVYAQNHPVMRLNCNSSADFVNGTVQGAQWYTLLGGMQDWVFFDRRSLELTMELHPVMRPDPPELLSMWDHNLPALMRFMEMGQMGLHGRLVDADTFLPLQGVVTVATPNHHRPTYIADNDGEFFMLLAPDVLYCITIHASDPLHPSHKYYAIHVAVLRMGRNKIISGSGPRSLTERSMFFAERVYVDAAPFSHGSSGPAAARRLQGNWRSQRQVLLGQAAAGMCSPLEEKSTVPGLAGAREVWG